MPKLTKMKLAMMIIAALAILSGLALREGEGVVFGAVIYALAHFVDVFCAYREAKLLRNEVTGATDGDPKISLSYRVAQWIDYTIAFTGLIILAIAEKSPDCGYVIGGGIIWFGAIISYLVIGLIAKHVACIPLSMGYGGWKVRRDRHGKIRK